MYNWSGFNLCCRLYWGHPCGTQVAFSSRICFNVWSSRHRREYEPASGNGFEAVVRPEASLFIAAVPFATLGPQKASNSGRFAGEGINLYVSRGSNTEGQKVFCYYEARWGSMYVLSSLNFDPTSQITCCSFLVMLFVGQSGDQAPIYDTLDAVRALVHELVPHKEPIPEWVFKLMDMLEDFQVQMIYSHVRVRKCYYGWLKGISMVHVNRSWVHVREVSSSEELASEFYCAGG